MVSSRGVVLLFSAALLFATPSTAAEVTAEGSVARSAPRTVQQVSWGDDRMSLGAPRDGPASAASTEPMRRLGRCRRWRDAASGLGETFAGHSLRAGLVSRHCALLEASESLHAHVWSWPWNMLDAGQGLPPRLHRSFGEWQIRCGDGADRRRCALIHQIAVVPGEPPHEPPVDVITTHFVIDHVAGREILLWRLFVPRRTSGQLVSAHGGAAGRTSELTGAAASSAAMPANGLTARLRIGPRRQSLRFTVCRAGGCMIEVGGAGAGKIATGLAAGHQLPLELFTGKPGTMRIEIGAEGFAEGLAELVRQRRLERPLSTPR